MDYSWDPQFSNYPNSIVTTFYFCSCFRGLKILLAHKRQRSSFADSLAAAFCDVDVETLDLMGAQRGKFSLNATMCCSKQKYLNGETNNNWKLWTFAFSVMMRPKATASARSNVDTTSPLKLIIEQRVWAQVLYNTKDLPLAILRRRSWTKEKEVQNKGGWIKRLSTMSSCVLSHWRCKMTMCWFPESSLPWCESYPCQDWPTWCQKRLQGVKSSAERLPPLENDLSRPDRRSIWKFVNLAPYQPAEEGESGTQF